MQSAETILTIDPGITNLAWAHGTSTGILTTIAKDDLLSGRSATGFGGGKLILAFEEWMKRETFQSIWTQGPHLGIEGQMKGKTMMFQCWFKGVCFGEDRDAEIIAPIMMRKAFGISTGNYDRNKQESEDLIWTHLVELFPWLPEAVQKEKLERERRTGRKQKPKRDDYCEAALHYYYLAWTRHGIIPVFLKGKAREEFIARNVRRRKPSVVGSHGCGAGSVPPESPSDPPGCSGQGGDQHGGEEESLNDSELVQRPSLPVSSYFKANEDHCLERPQVVEEEHSSGSGPSDDGGSCKAKGKRTKVRAKPNSTIRKRKRLPRK
jgi:hypothetical protein